MRCGGAKFKKFVIKYRVCEKIKRRNSCALFYFRGKGLPAHSPAIFNLETLKYEKLLYPNCIY